MSIRPRPHNATDNMSSFRDAVRNKVSRKMETDNAPIIIPGIKEQRGPNEWVQHSIVRYEGREIGRIQTRGFTDPNRPEEHLSIAENASRAGIQVQWLIRQAELEQWNGETFRAPKREAA